MTSATPQRKSAGLLPCLLAMAVAVFAFGTQAASFVLDLPGEGVLPGDFVAAAGEAPQHSLRWQSPVFATPFEFQLGEIVGIRAVGGEAGGADEPSGFRCRLTGGDAIDGQLSAIDADYVVLVPTGSEEPVQIPRSLVMGIVRRAAGLAGGYVGPAGLNGWDQQPASSWQDDAGRIGSDRPPAAVARDVGGSARARYDVTLSWQKQPELVISVAAGDGDASDAYRFEMLSMQDGLSAAMLVRQEPGRANLAEVAIPAPEQSRLRLSFFVDQAAGQLAVVVGDAREAVSLMLPPAFDSQPSGRFRVAVRSGDVCLEGLRVSDWTAAEPLAGNPLVSQAITTSGVSLNGDIESLDAATGVVIVQTGTDRETMPLAELQELRFSVSDEEDSRDEVTPQGAVRVVRRGGGILSGDLVAVTDDTVFIAREGIGEPIPVPLADLRSLASLGGGVPGELFGRAGRLVMDGVNVPGCLASGGLETGGLGWQPQGSVTASGFTAEALAQLSAVVEYVPPAETREAALSGLVEVGGIGGAVNQDENGFFLITMLSEDGAAARDGRIEPGDRIVAVRPAKTARFVESQGLDLETVMNLLRGRVGTPVSVRIQPAVGGEPKQIDLVRGLIYVADQGVLDQALAAHARLAAGQAAAAGESAGFPALVILRSGDTVAAAVEAIGPDGVRLRSSVTASGGKEPVTVAHALVQAIELDPSAASRVLDGAQLERLLTLPRSQRDNPPTHLLRMRTGDYLRGNLESLDAEGVEFRLLGQLKRLPRQSVARMIWLHPEDIDLDGKQEAAPADDEAVTAVGMAGLVVQGVSAGGERATLVADRVEGKMVVGASPAFGPSRIDTVRIDRLLIGRAVAAAGAELPFAKWKLRQAPQPRALRESETAEGERD
jgi:hypothetical protein